MVLARLVSLVKKWVQLTAPDGSIDALGADGWLAVADGGVGAAKAKGTRTNVMNWDPSILLGVRKVEVEWFVR